MTIIGTLPNNIQNGQTVDATPLMADFNFIVNQVNSNAVPTTGGVTLSGTFTGGSFSGQTINNAVIGGTTPAAGSFTQTTVGGTGVTTQANMFMSVQNAFTYFFLRNSDQLMAYYDSTHNVTRFSSDVSGNFVAAGNITANSDERLKENWEPLPEDFVARFALTKSGTYDRKDIHERQVGVSAQSLQKLMPEAVLEKDGTLSVAYGQAALVACVELAKEVVRLRAMLETVK